MQPFKRGLNHKITSVLPSNPFLYQTLPTLSHPSIHVQKKMECVEGELSRSPLPRVDSPHILSQECGKRSYSEFAEDPEPSPCAEEGCAAGPKPVTLRIGEATKQGLQAWTGTLPRKPKSEHNEDVMQSFRFPDGSRILVVADGHGGPSCAQYVAMSVVSSFGSYFEANGQPGSVCTSTMVKDLQDIVRRIDKEFCEMRTEQFQSWHTAGASTATKPLNDGCTLLVAYIPAAADCIVLVHVGDSRGIVYQYNKDSRRRGDSWRIVHATKDRDLTQYAIAKKLSDNGGAFNVSYGGGMSSHTVKIRGGGVQKHLKMAYVRNPLQKSLPVYIEGRGVNCEAMGNIYLKPPNADIMEVEPDVTIVPLHPGERYVLVLATDGLFGAMKAPGTGAMETDADKQNKLVASQLAKILPEEVTSLADFDWNLLPYELIQWVYTESEVPLTENRDDTTVMAVYLEV